MTTICFRDGVLAADSWISENGVFVGYGDPKIEKSHFFWVTGDGVLKEFEPGGFLPTIDRPFAALGSGSEFALGAMAAGASAAEAVEIACQYDLNSSLPVVWYG